MSDPRPCPNWRCGRDCRLLRKGDAFDIAIGKIAIAYADQTLRDHQALVDAVKSDRIAAEVGV
jgi:hypothetical protein